MVISLWLSVICLKGSEVQTNDFSAELQVGNSDLNCPDEKLEEMYSETGWYFSLHSRSYISYNILSWILYYTTLNTIQGQ